MKKIKKVIIVLAMMIAMVGFVNPMTVDASRTYKVTFRAVLNSFSVQSVAPLRETAKLLL